jgi:hypothetical protein
MRSHSRSFVVQTFVEDLTISCPSDVVGVPHRVAAFDDLSALDVSPTFCTHLIRGCPYVTLTTAQGAGAVDVVVASVHAFMEVASCNQHATKWHLRMNSGQTFLLYASASIRLAQTDNTHLSALGFAGVIRVAYLPDTSMEPVLDRYSRCFPTSGEAALNQPFCLAYHWRKAGCNRGAAHARPPTPPSAARPRLRRQGARQFVVPKHRRRPGRRGSICSTCSLLLCSHASDSRGQKRNIGFVDSCYVSPDAKRVRANEL